VTQGGSDPSCPDVQLWCGGPRLSELADSIAAEAGGERPDLWLVHATVPHVPWIRTPEGRQYEARTLGLAGVAPGGSWLDAQPYNITQGLQRHLWQVGYVDRLLGELMDRLEEEGLWDEAMLVVTADHGVSFTPGAPLRAPTPETLHEIYNVPLFVKVPGQQSGGADPGNALTIDVLPTIVDALDIETDWELDGESLLAEDHRPDKPVRSGGSLGALPPEFEGVLAVARRNQALLPNGEGWEGVIGSGPYGDLVGTPVSRLATGGAAGSATWTVDEAATLADWDPAGDLTPVFVHGRIDTDASPPPTDALIAVNGTVAGVVGGLVEYETSFGFTSLLSEDLLRPGANEVVLLIPTSPGGRTFAELPLAS
jgi:hypothetical protein